jgi:hypothetical protein
MKIWGNGVFSRSDVISNLYPDTMSRSYHVTYKKDIKKLSVREIIEQSSDLNSDFNEWSKKLAIKDSVSRLRKLSKKIDN